MLLLPQFWLGSRIRQQGAVLLLFVVFSVISLSATLMVALNRQLPGLDQQQNLPVLQTAREALIGYALTFADLNSNRLPGYLPCPDMDGDGLADAPCGNPGESALGRLPWQTLGLAPLRDSDGECLWYAVSGNYKEDPPAGLSVDADGQFIVHDVDLGIQIGATALDQAITVVFAPGKVTTGQIRSVSPGNRTECGSTSAADAINNASNFLDSRNGIDNGSGTRSGASTGFPGSLPIPSPLPHTLIASPRVPSTSGADFNDTMAWVTPQHFDDIYGRMQIWVGDRIRGCLQSYGTANGGKYPWPSVLDGTASPDYQDDNNARFGRVATVLSDTAAAGLSGSWPSNCFSWSWWIDWREMVFYAVDKNSAPAITAGSTVQVDGTGTSIGLLVAGRRSSSQSRASNNDKGDIGNYLESGNIPASGPGLIPPGDEDFLTTVMAVPSDDYVCTTLNCP